MKRFIFGAVFAAVLATAPGCAPTDSSLKGKVVNGAEPVTPGGEMVSLGFFPVGPDGKLGKDRYSAVLSADGTFEFVASGGRLPPGKYRVAIDSASVGPPTPGKAAKPKSERFAKFATAEQSKLEITVEPGANDVTVDLAKSPG